MGLNAEKQALLETCARIHSKWMFRGKFISVRQDEIDFPNGAHKTWDIVVHPGAVAIVPVTQDGKIILIEQFRRAIGRITLEIPAGLLDPGEAPEEAAQRELQEEIGFRANQLTLWGTYYASPGVSTEQFHLFLAKELIKNPLSAEDTDQIDIRVTALEEALELIENGTICDTKTTMGILKLARG